MNLKTSENLDRLRRIIINGLANCTKCPVDVTINNYTRVKTANGPGSTRWHFDIQILKYLKNVGAYPVDTVLKSLRFDNYVVSKSGQLKDVNPFALKQKRGKTERKNNSITVAFINKICKTEDFGCRLALKKKSSTGVKGTFWHPTYGYSEKNYSLAQWAARPTDPFNQRKRDLKQIENIELLIHDNYLSDLYVISPLPASLIRDQNNQLCISIFCKLHQTHNVQYIASIHNFLTFNCPNCWKKDFGGALKIKYLRINPDSDTGTTWVYLIKLMLNGTETLKFGITKRIPSFSVSEDIEKRYRKIENKVVEIIKYHPTETELIARELEQKMLMKTLVYLNTEIKSDFGGYTECRVSSKNSLAVCTNTFDLTISSL